MKQGNVDLSGRTQGTLELVVRNLSETRQHLYSHGITRELDLQKTGILPDVQFVGREGS